MKYSIILAGALFALSLASTTSRAEVKVVSDRNEGAAATAAFKFKSVPAPSATDAATKGRFSVVAGEMDPNGGGIEVLNDGRLPEDEDEPDANFFFNAGTSGGRLVLELEEAREILRVNTYSWHSGGRGPQVYKLYAADGTAKDFNAKPARADDPEKAGWKLVASVDTRPKEGEPGGQYGASILDPSGAPLGKYRYLLFDISPAREGDRFGNTFFGEIDVDDGKAYAAPPAAAAASGKYEIVIDSSEMPELQDWIEKTLRPALEKWYPIIVDSLPSEGYTAPRRLTVVFRKNMRGVAATGGRRISCAGDWFKKNLEGEAAGAVVHELVHVAQSYRGRGNPGWLVEGVADYIRWFKYEPESKRPRPNPARAKYTDSYRTTGAFLNYVTETHDKDIVKKLNAAMRQGKYSPDLWKEITGKTVDELWAEYVKTLEKR